METSHHDAGDRCCEVLECTRPRRRSGAGADRRCRVLIADRSSCKTTAQLFARYRAVGAL